MLDARIPLMARGVEMPSQGNALMQMLALRNAQQANQLQAMQMTDRQAIMQERQQEAQRLAQERAIEAEAMAWLRQHVAGKSPQQALAGGGGPTVANAAQIGARQPLDAREAYARGVPVAKIQEAAGLDDIGRRKVARTVEGDDGTGNKVTRLLDEFGRDVTDAVPGYVAPVQVGLGNRVAFMKPKDGVSMAVGMSPSERDASARGWAGINIQRQAEARQATAAKSGVPVVATEAERKAGTLLSRLRDSSAQLDAALKEEPGAAKPGLLAEGVRKIPLVGGDTPANVVTGQARQRVEAAQLDILDAALTLGTGAAYTREQLEGYRRSYFPQIGDDKRTVADKQDRLQNLIRAAEIAAGRAANPQPAAVPAASKSITVDW